MYDIRELFVDAAALIEEERNEHIALCNRLFDIVSLLNCETADNFIDDDLAETIAGQLVEVVAEYPLPRTVQNTVFHVIEGSLEETRRVLDVLRDFSAPNISHYDYIVKRNESLVAGIVSYLPERKQDISAFSLAGQGGVSGIVEDCLSVPMIEKEAKGLLAMRSLLRHAFDDLYKAPPEKILDEKFFWKMNTNIRLLVLPMPEDDVFGVFSMIYTNLEKIRGDIADNIIGNKYIGTLQKRRLMESYIEEAVNDLSVAMYPPLGNHAISKHSLRFIR